MPLDNSFKITSKWSTNGTADGQFVHPTGIAIDSNGKIYIVDTGNNRIEKFDSNNAIITIL